MTNQPDGTPQTADRKEQRLNKLASLTGMAALFVFLVILLLIMISPPEPEPAPTPRPTLTPSLTVTPSPSPSPSPTVTPLPAVELIAVEYLQPGVGCQVEVTVNVNGGALSGVFHVWSASHADPAGILSEVETLPSGVSTGYLLNLGTPQAESAAEEYEIWFEYPEGVSNRLTGLTCPAPTETPTP